MNIFNRLEADHRAQRALVERLLLAPEGAAEVCRLFDILCDEIEAHNAAVEQTLYAALLGRLNDQRLVCGGVDRHDAVAELIAAVSALEAGSADWRAGMAQLVESLDRQRNGEEDEAVAAARMLIDREVAERLGDSFERSKENWIEIFGRVSPAERQMPPVPARRAAVARRVAGQTLRGRPAAWFRRWRRPRHDGAAPRPGGVAAVQGSPTPTKSSTTR